MLILGIETATEQVGVAIGGHEGVIATFEVARGRRHAEILTPAIEFVCRQADIELCEIGCIAVDVGPGLFTGMRVGLASGKALAQALRMPMIGITSLDLLAFPCRHTDRVVVPVIDARKGEVFWAMYRPVPGGVQQVTRPPSVPSTSSSPTCWRAARRCCASATARALPRRDPRRLPLRDRRLRPTRRRRRSCSSPTPVRCARSGCSPDEIEPIYLRPPDAQINWATREVAADECARPCCREPTAPIGDRCRVGDDRADAAAAPPRGAADRARRVPEAVVARGVRERARQVARRQPLLRRRPPARGRSSATPGCGSSRPRRRPGARHQHRGGRRRTAARRRRPPARDRSSATAIAAAGASRGRSRCGRRTPPPRSCTARFGFAPAGVRKRYYENTEDAIVMWCHDIRSRRVRRALARAGVTSAMTERADDTRRLDAGARHRDQLRRDRGGARDGRQRRRCRASCRARSRSTPTSAASCPRSPAGPTSRRSTR